MNSVGSSPGMNRLPRTRQPGGWLSVRSRPQLLTLTWCISDGVLPRNVSPIHAPGDPAVSMPRMTMGADAEPCARSDPAPYLPNVSPEVSARSEEHTSELQSRLHLVCRLLLEKKKKKQKTRLKNI